MITVSIKQIYSFLNTFLMLIFCAQSYSVSASGFLTTPLLEELRIDVEKALEEPARASVHANLPEFKIIITEGKLYSSAMTPLNGFGFIFVMSAGGDFYAERPGNKGVVHHSDFFQGASVAMAGEFDVEDGILRRLSNKSGHYKPSLEFLKQAQAVLSGFGISETYEVEVIESVLQPIIEPASWLRFGGASTVYSAMVVSSLKHPVPTRFVSDYCFTSSRFNYGNLQRSWLPVENPKIESEKLISDVQSICSTILEKYPKESWIIVGIGRSPTAFISYLKETPTDISYARTLPLSNFRYEATTEEMYMLCTKHSCLGDLELIKLFSHFDVFLPSLEVLDGRSILLLDFVGNTGMSVVSATKFIKRYYKKLMDEKPELKKVIIKSAPIVGFNSFSNALNTFRYSFELIDKEKIIVLDDFSDLHLALMGSEFDDYAEYGQYLVNCELPPERNEANFTKYFSILKLSVFTF